MPGVKLGAQQPDVAVVEHNPAWATAFEAEATRVREALGDLLARIDHVGSTAVAGLAAKPTVDIQASVTTDPIPLEAIAERLEPLGYVHVPMWDPVNYPMFARPRDGHRLFHLHVCAAGGDQEHRHLAVVEYLRTHPGEVAAYADIKLRLATAHPNDRPAYVAGKDAFVKALEQRALTWAEKRPR
jgi:GrpB-like predicted nucleotidyltransferase (UPF0157 family)